MPHAHVRRRGSATSSESSVREFRPNMCILIREAAGGIPVVIFVI